MSVNRYSYLSGKGILILLREDFLSTMEIDVHLQRSLYNKYLCFIFFALFSHTFVTLRISQRNDRRDSQYSLWNVSQ